MNFAPFTAKRADSAQPPATQSLQESTISQQQRNLASIQGYPSLYSRFYETQIQSKLPESTISLQEQRNFASIQGYPTLYSKSYETQLESKLSANPDLQSNWIVRRSSRFWQFKSTDQSKLWSPISLSEFKQTYGVRNYSTNPFSHLDSSGRARMVDVSRKRVTVRTAVAECNLIVGDELLKLLKDGALPKGDALGVARVAGVMAAKRTSELIPLCHPLPLDYVHVSIELPEKDNSVNITCEVRVTARTGAEMEALSGCSGAALALYDMCKAVDKEMVISDLRVVRKTGGKSDYPPPKTPEFPPTETSKPVDWPKETFAPINLAIL